MGRVKRRANVFFGGCAGGGSESGGSGLRKRGGTVGIAPFMILTNGQLLELWKE